MSAIDPGSAYRGSLVVFFVFAVVFYGSIYAIGTFILNSCNEWCQHRIDQKWYREHPGLKEKPISEWTLQELQEWSKRNYLRTNSETLADCKNGVLLQPDPWIKAIEINPLVDFPYTHGHNGCEGCWVSDSRDIGFPLEP